MSRLEESKNKVARGEAFRDVFVILKNVVSGEKKGCLLGQGEKEWWWVVYLLLTNHIELTSCKSRRDFYP